MTLTFTVAGSALPLPRADNPYDLEYLPFGVAQRMFSGTLRVQYITNKYRTRIYWTGLTKTERDSLAVTYATYLRAAAVWIFPDGLTFTGLIPNSSWTESIWYEPHSGANLYDVNFTVEQQ